MDWARCAGTGGRQNLATLCRLCTGLPVKLSRLRCAELHSRVISRLAFFIVWVVGPSVIFTFLNPNGLEQTKLFFAFLFPTLAGYVHEGGEH